MTDLGELWWMPIGDFWTIILGRNIGLVARAIRQLDPDTPLTYRNWSTMTSVGNSSTGYDLGTGAAHLDFLSPETYDTSPWPEHREWGFRDDLRSLQKRRKAGPVGRVRLQRG